MKTNRLKTQFTHLESSSSYNETIRKIFCEDPFFSHLRCFQEVPVAELVEGYHNPYHKMDWFIKELGIVIEVHGQQHYKPVNFTGASWLHAKRDFHEIVHRDNEKKFAVEQAGYIYVEIPFSEIKTMDGPSLKKKILGESNGK